MQQAPVIHDGKLFCCAFQAITGDQSVWAGKWDAYSCQRAVFLLIGMHLSYCREPSSRASKPQHGAGISRACLHLAWDEMLGRLLQRRFILISGGVLVFRRCSLVVMAHLASLPLTAGAPNRWSAVWLNALPRWVQPTKHCTAAEVQQASVIHVVIFSSSLSLIC